MICPCCGKPKRPANLDGLGTALKPAMELIAVARKPLAEKTIAANVLAHGTGALNIDGCRVETDEDQRRPSSGGENGLVGTGTFKIRERRVEDQVRAAGRWPANVCHDGSAEVVAGFPADAGGYDKRVGIEPGRRPGGFGDIGPDAGSSTPNGALYSDSGSAARFFYTAKADAEDRLGSKHPTVKPISLMRWLCRLVTPPGGLILDPFAGTGSTGLAALGEGFDCILIEREAEYFADIERRLAWARGEGRLTAQESSRQTVDEPLGGLFAEPASQPASQPASVAERDGKSTACSRTKVHRANGTEVVKS
jgi:DNA methylase